MLWEVRNLGHLLGLAEYETCMYISSLCEVRIADGEVAWFGRTFI